MNVLKQSHSDIHLNLFRLSQAVVSQEHANAQGFTLSSDNMRSKHNITTLVTTSSCSGPE